MYTILDQIRRNAVALISMAIAISSLGYNTWRNEVTEYNRNTRYAGFEIILKMGELQRIVLHSHYGQQDVRQLARDGWVSVLQIQDLSQIMPLTVKRSAENLQSHWSANWEGLGNDTDNLYKINLAIDQMRSSTLAALHALD